MNYDLLYKVYQHPLLNHEALTRICQAHQYITFEKGGFLLQKGQIAQGYYILETGLIRAYVYDYNGQDKTLDFYSPTEVAIDVLSLFQRSPAQEDMQVLTSGTAWYIAYDDFQELYHTIPGFSEWGRLWMTTKLFYFKQRALDMITLSAKDRYINLYQTKPEIIKSAPLKHIASFLGITDTSFSRIRKEIL